MPCQTGSASRRHGRPGGRRGAQRDSGRSARRRRARWGMPTAKRAAGASTCYRGPGPGCRRGPWARPQGRPIGGLPTVVSGSAAEPPPWGPAAAARLSPKRRPAGPALQRCRHVTIRRHAAPTRALPLAAPLDARSLPIQQGGPRWHFHRRQTSVSNGCPFAACLLLAKVPPRPGPGWRALMRRSPFALFASSYPVWFPAPAGPCRNKLSATMFLVLP